MKAILTIPGREISFELDDATYSQFMVVAEKIREDGITCTRERVGEPITIVTSNMPEELRRKVAKLIGEYCNHPIRNWTFHNSEMEELNEREKDLVIDALNEYWHHAVDELSRSDLGDMERKNWETVRHEVNTLLRKLGSF